MKTLAIAYITRLYSFEEQRIGFEQIIHCFPLLTHFLSLFPFRYVISTLELMVAEDYMIVYLNGATPRRKMPGLGWMKRCYQMIDRRSVAHGLLAFYLLCLACHTYYLKARCPLLLQYTNICRS